MLSILVLCGSNKDTFLHFFCNKDRDQVFNFKNKIYKRTFNWVSNLQSFCKKSITLVTRSMNGSRVEKFYLLWFLVCIFICSTFCVPSIHLLIAASFWMYSFFHGIITTTNSTTGCNIFLAVLDIIFPNMVFNLRYWEILRHVLMLQVKSWVCIFLRNYF